MKNLSALLADLVGDMLPQLARAVFRVEELLDQRRLGALLLRSPSSFCEAKAFLRKCMMAVVSDSPLMRCAPHSALI